MWLIMERAGMREFLKLHSSLMGGEEFMPASRSQASKWTKVVRDRLPKWTTGTVQPRDSGRTRPGEAGGRRCGQGQVAASLPGGQARDRIYRSGRHIGVWRSGDGRVIRLILRARRSSFQ